MNILVRTPNWIGDQILAFPFFHFLRKAYPRARIAAACIPWVESLQYLDRVDEVILLPRPRSGSWLDRWEALERGAKQLRDSGPWDLAITLPNSFSSAWMLFRAGIPIRRGFDSDARGFLLNQKVSWEKVGAPLHRSEAYLALLPEKARATRSVAEFWGVLPENPLDPKIPGEADAFYPQKSWKDTDPIEPPQGPFWVLAPGSAAETRRWPARNFASLARMIQEETGWRGIIVGGPAESKLAESLCSDPGLRLEDWTGRGTVASLYRIFQQTKFTVANDSGVAHVASLCGSPVAITWGAGEPKRTLPIGPGKVTAVLNPIECWPCERNVCARATGQKLECLGGILPETVWKEIRNGPAMRDSRG